MFGRLEYLVYIARKLKDMINKDFYPTPLEVINDMIFGLDVYNKEVLEPSAGSGNIVDVLNDLGANVSACEIEPKLRNVLQNKCDLIGDDFLKLTKEDCSHFNFIIMNPPFSADETHIIHAWNVAPSGCEIIALCNNNTLSNTYSRNRKELMSIINNYGQSKNLGNVFSEAERETDIEIGMVRLFKPMTESDDFSMFFETEDSDISSSVEGIMPYNSIRDIVQRVVGAMKIYDTQMEQAILMNNTIGLIGGMKDMSFVMKNEDKQYNRETFRREVQKNAWSWVFRKMNMDKYMTSGVKEQINKFIVQQRNIPFTMKNIYQMIDFIVQTYPNQIDKSIEEVFDKMTTHYHDNRFNVEGWKTNSHYILNEKFILPGIVYIGYSGGYSISYGNISVNLVNDLLRVLCYLTGKDYDKCMQLSERMISSYYIMQENKFILDEYNNRFIKKFRYSKEAEDYISKKDLKGCLIYPPMRGNTWYDWEFFEIKFFKKGTMHFKFKNKDVWAVFNQNVARIKGFQLPDKI